MRAQDSSTSDLLVHSASPRDRTIPLPMSPPEKVTWFGGSRCLLVIDGIMNENEVLAGFVRDSYSKIPTLTDHFFHAELLLSY